MSQPTDDVCGKLFKVDCQLLLHNLYIYLSAMFKEIKYTLQGSQNKMLLIKNSNDSWCHHCWL